MLSLFVSSLKSLLKLQLALRKAVGAYLISLGTLQECRDFDETKAEIALFERERAMETR